MIYALIIERLLVVRKLPGIRVKDICRIESFATHINSFKRGYVLWLSNEPSYWRTPTRESAGYAAFSVHNGAMKTGSMKWAAHLSMGTTRGREQDLFLNGEYEIIWKVYSDLGIPNGLFQYALLSVDF